MSDMHKDMCITCGNRLDDLLECVNYLIWKGSEVPELRNEIIQQILSRKIIVPGLVIQEIRAVESG